MSKLRIGTVGVGRFGIFHLHAFKQLEETHEVELIAACDHHLDKDNDIQKEFGISTYTNFEEMIESERLDALSVATQDHLHKDIAMFALKNNVHVLVEKPLDTCTNGASEMVATAEENNLLLQVDFHKRYDPYHIEIKQLAEQRKFGDFLYGYCYMEDQIIVPRDWFKSWVENTSPAWFLGSNFIDLMCWIMDSKVISVHAIGHKNKLLSLGLDTYDSIQSTLTFENNAVITFDSSWILPEQYSAIVNQGFRIIGTEGIIEADSHKRGTTSCFTSDQNLRNLNSGFMTIVKDIDGRIKYDGYGIKSIQHFIENIIHLKSNRTLNDLTGSYPSGKDALHVTKVIEAIHTSISIGEKIEFEKDKSYADKV